MCTPITPWYVTEAAGHGHVDREWFVAIGVDYDPDGNATYAYAVRSDNVRDAIEEIWDSGITDVVTIPEAFLEYGVRTRELLENTDMHGNPFRYQQVHVDWKPWAFDDSIGIPALDHTYDDPIFNDDDLEMR